MKNNTIIILIISVVVFAAVVYTLTGTESPEDYIEKIEAERERQFKFIRFNFESPLTDEQKQSFTKLNFYPMREVPLTDGTKEKYIEHSWAEFELNGKSEKLLLLQAMNEPDKRNFFLAFADETSAVDTYGGGRYINARQDGKNSITIDFNLAYNPYCAYNPDYGCPLPPKENLLDIPIPVGEKNYEK